MELWSIAIQVTAALAFLGYYLHRKFSYWADRGVKGPQAWPWNPFGNILHFVTHGMMATEKEWFAKYGKVYGYYSGPKPKLTVADAELVKQVMVKDFGNFVNRETLQIGDPFFGENLFNLEDERWRKIRTITSPAFTTGKLRGMYGIMNGCVDKLAAYFRKVISIQNGEIDTKEVIAGFSIDIVASTLFATETNANDDRSLKNPFRQHGLAFTQINLLRLFSFDCLPEWFNKAIGNSVGTSERNLNFFVNISKQIIERRRAQAAKPNAPKYNDLVQLMMDSFVYEDELKKANYEKLTATADEDTIEPHEATQVTNGSIKRTLTESEIIAQCILFFLAAFETTATTLTNAFYELALNPHVQDRLKSQLDEALGGLEENSKEYYEAVIQLPYLNAVIKETLRMYPPLTRIQRKVGLDGYKLDGIRLKKGQIIDIGIYAVHHCAEYYPDPERFNPDRFLPENKHLLVPYTYLPFGEGPRNCIGMRFAYQEMKLCLAKLIRQFRISHCAKTQIPPSYNSFNVLSPKNLILQVSNY